MGSDWGTSVSTSLALQHPGRLLGIHLVPPLAPPDRAAGDLTDDERAALADLGQRSRTGSGYSAGAGHPAADHRLFADRFAGRAVRLDRGEAVGLDRPPRRPRSGAIRRPGAGQHHFYWLTGTGASSARLYWESIAQVTQWFSSATGDIITVPAGCSIFPKEVPRPSRRWAQRRFTNTVHWNQPDRGGHFAAWEQPSLFTDEVRAVAHSCTPRPRQR
jgi:epoxide hydrolase